MWPVRGGVVGTPINYYCDNDNDGYISSSISGNCTGGGCVPSGCQITQGDDCNDTPVSGAAIHPGATEICNGIDDDCNAGTSDGSGEIWYGTACDGPDSDLCKEGTYGCTNGVQSCSDNTGNNTEGPYGDLTCSDGKDNDCDGLTDATDSGCFPPDLLVSSWTAPANACAGATISIKDTTKNQGTGTAGASQTCFYFSTNTILDPGDITLYKPDGSRACRSIPSLPPGGISTGTTSVTLPNVSIGKYYLIAMADDGKAVTESNETNNKKSKVIYIGTDLTVVSIVPSPLKPVAGQNVSITVTVKNIGCPAAGPFVIDFYKHLTTPPVSYQVGDIRCSKSGLGSGLTTTCTGVISYAAAGTYNMRAQVDTDQQVVEANETNNKKNRVITISP